MPLDFPNGPTVGATYTGPGGVVWTYDGAKWASGASTTAFAPIGSPAFTGDPTAPTPAYGDNDTSVATTAFVQAAVAPMTNNVGRNLLHNPLFNVAQRGAGPWATSVYTADRWKTSIVTDTATFSIVPMGDADRAAIGDEAVKFALLNTCTGNAAAGASNSLFQPIEDVRRLSGKTITLSFWAQCSAALKLGINIFQYFGTGGSPSATIYALATGLAVSITGAWGRYTATIAIPSVAGKTVGTNGDSATNVQFFYSSGATGNAAAGNIGVQSGSFNLWGVQLEIGSVATPLEKPDPQQDLAKCQRFYQVGGGQLYFFASNAGVPQGVGVYQPQSMRATPTAALNVSANTNGTGISLQVINQSGMLFYANSVAGGTVNVSFNFDLSADL